MESLVINSKGQITLRRDLLVHLGIKPGERIECEKLSGRELLMKAARPAGTIDDFIGRHAGKMRKPLTIDEMSEITGLGRQRMKMIRVLLRTQSSRSPLRHELLRVVAPSGRKA